MCFERRTKPGRRHRADTTTIGIARLGMLLQQPRRDGDLMHRAQLKVAAYPFEQRPHFPLSKDHTLQTKADTPNAGNPLCLPCKTSELTHLLDLLGDLLRQVLPQAAEYGHLERRHRVHHLLQAHRELPHPAGRPHTVSALLSVRGQSKGIGKRSCTHSLASTAGGGQASLVLSA